MGNLSNLYISQSFISLIHLGSDNTASGVSTQLEDGLGNGIGIYVNTSGSVSASSYSGSVNGIGNVSAFSTSVDSRLDNLELFSSSLDATFATDAQLNASSSTLQANINTKLDTASFNAYTQSTNTFTASISTSVGNLEAYAAYSNQVLITQSFQINANALTASNATTALSQSLYFTDTTQSANINSLTALTSSTVRNNQNNTYTAGTTQSFDNITANSASITYLKVIFQTSSVVYSSGSNILGDNANDDVQTLIGRNILTGSAEVTGSLKVTSDISSSTISGIGNVTLYSASVAASITSSTANVTTLSASIYQTDSTQSYQITANALTASNELSSYSSSQSTLNNTLSSSIATNSSSIGLLQTFSGSQYKSDSSSFDSRIDSLEFASGGFVTTSSFNSYTSSQDFKNTTFATTGSNTFTGGNTFVTTIGAQNGLSTAGQTTFGDGVILNTFSLENISGSLVFNKIATASKVDFKNLSLLVSGAITASGDISSSGNIYAANLTASVINTGSFATTGSNVFIGNQTLSGSLFISGNINMVNGADLITHHVRAAGSNGLELQTSAGTNIVQMGAGGGTQAAFVGAVTANSVSASTINGLGDPLAFSTSVDSRLDNLELGSSSVSTSVGLLQTFSGSQYKADSASFDSRINAAGGAPVVLDEGTILGNATAFNFIGSGVTATLSAGTASVTIPGGSAPAGTVSSSQQIIELGFLQTSSFNAYTQSTNDFTASITASFNSLSSSYVATSQSFNDLSSSFLLVSASTLRFATTGSNNFVGNQTITGSLILSSSAVTELQVIGAVELTGSVAGNITALSVASNTASIDFNLGSFFTLTIPSSTITYITGSNLKPGQTANIILTQQVTTGSVRFESTLFKFPSGSINTGSAIASAVDMVSVASVNSTTLFSVTANRLI